MDPNQYPPINQPNPGGVPPTQNWNEQPGNPMAIAGFVLICISAALFWFLIITSILWLLGLIFSIAGLVNANKGAANRSLAIAGVIMAVVFGILYIIIIAVAFSDPEIREELRQEIEDQQTHRQEESNYGFQPTVYQVV